MFAIRGIRFISKDFYIIQEPLKSCTHSQQFLGSKPVRFRNLNTASEFYRVARYQIILAGTQTKKKRGLKWLKKVKIRLNFNKSTWQPIVL